MIDIHTHVLFGLDDGAQTLDESMTIIQTIHVCEYLSL